MHADLTAIIIQSNKIVSDEVKDMSCHALVAQLCQTFCSLIDCSPPGPWVHGILQERILEWIAIPSSRASSQSRDRTWSPTLQADSLLSEPAGNEALVETSYIKSWMTSLANPIQSGIQKDICKLKTVMFFKWGHLNPINDLFVQNL